MAAHLNDLLNHLVICGAQVKRGGLGLGKQQLEGIKTCESEPVAGDLNREGKGGRRELSRGIPIIRVPLQQKLEGEVAEARVGGEDIGKLHVRGCVSEGDAARNVHVERAYGREYLPHVGGRVAGQNNGPHHEYGSRRRHNRRVKGNGVS